MKELALKQIFKVKMKVTPRIKILEPRVLLILTYGAQAKALSLQSTQRSMERNILGMKRKDRIKNSVVKEETGATDILEIIGKMENKIRGTLGQNEKRYLG